MNAVLMVLALGAAPAVAEREDPELAVEEAKAVRKELIAVRAELRRLAARAEALKVRQKIGAEAPEVEERLAKHTAYQNYDAQIREAETKSLEVHRGLSPDLAKLKVEGLQRRIEYLRNKQAKLREEIRQSTPDELEVQRVYLSALEQMLVADLKRLTGR